MRADHYNHRLIILSPITTKEIQEFDTNQPANNDYSDAPGTQDATMGRVHSGAIVGATTTGVRGHSRGHVTGDNGDALRGGGEWTTTTTSTSKIEQKKSKPDDPTGVLPVPSIVKGIGSARASFANWVKGRRHSTVPATTAHASSTSRPRSHFHTIKPWLPKDASDEVIQSVITSMGPRAYDRAVRELDPNEFEHVFAKHAKFAGRVYKEVMHGCLATVIVTRIHLRFHETNTSQIGIEW